MKQFSREPNTMRATGHFTTVIHYTLSVRNPQRSRHERKGPKNHTHPNRPDHSYEEGFLSVPWRRQPSSLTLRGLQKGQQELKRFHRRPYRHCESSEEDALDEISFTAPFEETSLPEPFQERNSKTLQLLTPQRIKDGADKEIFSLLRVKEAVFVSESALAARGAGLTGRRLLASPRRACSCAPCRRGSPSSRTCVRCGRPDAARAGSAEVVEEHWERCTAYKIKHFTINSSL